MFGEIFEQLTDAHRRIAEIERRQRNRKRTGKIVKVDGKKGLARVELMEKGADGNPVLTAWIPWKEVSMGEIKTHFPPSVGEQVTVVSENGDLTDAEIDTSVPSNSNKRPHDKEGEMVRDMKGFREKVDSAGNLTIDAKTIKLTAGNATIFAKSGEVTVSVGGKSIVITADEIVTHGKTRLNNGNQKIHRVGDRDSDQDVAMTGADDVFA